MVLNAAVQMLREADELKEKILKFKSGTSMLQEQSVWTTQQQLQKVYQKVLVLDLDYALEKKVEQDLWNVGFKQQIEALQAISKDRKNPLRSEAQAMLSWVLQAAAGFYLCLLHQICTTFKLDLPFRRRASLLGLVEEWGAGRGAAPPAAAARYVTQHCLVHLGDLARYRHQLRVAHTFYRHAVCVSVHCGQPYNQLALVAWRRGRVLAALYWHVRSLLVRAPFPPAPANLRRTLTQHSQSSEPLPVLGGESPATAAPALPTRLDAHSFVTELIRAVNFIHSVEELKTAEALVSTLNSSLIALVATDSFEPMTLIKMACVIIWLVHSTTDNLTVDIGAMSADENTAATLSVQLAAGSLLALLLAMYAKGAEAARATPAVKVWLEWAAAAPAARAHVLARPALCGALAAALNAAPAPPRRAPATYDTVPLPEDEELHGFLPLEASFARLRFASHASWDAYAGALPQVEHSDDPVADISTTSFSNEPELERKIRVYRILQLGKRIADLHPDRLTYTEEDGVCKFTAAPLGQEELSISLTELQRSAAQSPAQPAPDEEAESDDELAPPPPRPPLVISEADFREKVIEKRVGILKPQGSLERAREERALANSQDDQEIEISEYDSKDDKKDAKKLRVNIAMAAIMRKQEETNKQVKFVTPPLTPEVPDVSPVKENDKPKIIQPKVMKSLANLPVGRKTGGILSLKDKSAGYPHLVNTEPEPPKKTEKDEKKEPKPNPGPSQNSQQSYPQKRHEAPPSSSWTANASPATAFSEAPRMGFHKNYGAPAAGAAYRPPGAPAAGPGIRLPVVNPKEIDVRTAALQKQNSRQEMFQEGHKFGQNYPISSDKKNFLNDLPPRFANQYRYWQTAQDTHFGDNKFKDDSPKSNMSVFTSQAAPQRQSWLNPAAGGQDAYPQPLSWWKPDPAQNFTTNFSTPPPNMQSNFYSPVMNTNLTSPYPNMLFANQMSNQSMGQNKPENVITPPSYHPSGISQPPVQPLQNLVSPNFNSSLSGFGSYPPTVTYDASMYPQFSNNLGYQPLMMDKPQSYQAGKDPMDMSSLGFRNNLMDNQQRSYGDAMSEMGTAKNLDQSSSGDGGSGGSYSLFSGAAGPPPWTPQAHPHQSLWSGPGPSPLERLLEQQKQMKQPPAPQ